MARQGGEQPPAGQSEKPARRRSPGREDIVTGFQFLAVGLLMLVLGPLLFYAALTAEQKGTLTTYARMRSPLGAAATELLPRNVQQGIAMVMGALFTLFALVLIWAAFKWVVDGLRLGREAAAREAQRAARRRRPPRGTAGGG